MSIPVRTLISVALLVAVFAPAGAAQASADFGITLTEQTPDVTPWVEPLSSVALCYVDDDGNNNYGAGESVLLHTFGGCTESQGVIRLARFQQSLPGAQVGGSDADGRAAHTAFTTSPTFSYIDLDANGRVSFGDTVYIDVLNPSSARVEVGDIRVTPRGDLPGGVQVVAGDADLALTMSSIGTLSELFGYTDVNGNDVFDTKDHLYLKSSGPTSTSVVLGLNDLRMGGAKPETYGSWVELGDPDAPVVLGALPSAVVCFASDDAAYAAGETVILRTANSCTGQLAVGDQRLASDDHHGLRVQAGDPEVGRDLHPMSSRFMFVERNGIAGYGVGDELYLDMTDSPNRVDHGDVRLMAVAGHPAASPVRESDSDHGATTTQLGTFADFLGYADRDGNGVFDRDDLLYLNANGGGAEDVAVGDTRLGHGPEGFFFGSQVTTGSPDAVRRLTSVLLDVCVLDEDGDTAYDSGEAVYLNPNGCGDLAASALRLVEVGGRGAGTRVAGGPEIGRDLFAPTAELVFSDVDLSSGWSSEDTLYLHFATSSTSVDLGDIRLTPWGSEPPGEAVGANDGDRSIGLIDISSNVASLVRYYDVDAGGTLSTEDVVYLDPAQGVPSAASHGLVRLTLLAPAQVAPQVTVSPTPSPTPTQSPTDSPPANPDATQTDSPTPDQTLTESPPAGDEENGETPRTPGPTAVLVLATVALALWAARRR